MAELTNLTDRISHLRDREGSSPVVQGGVRELNQPVDPSRAKLSERRFAIDYFIIFVYALLGVAVLTQFALLVWLDVV
jgi:nitrate reductase NapE component